MASVGITIAKRGSSSVRTRLVRSGQSSLNNAAFSLLGRRSIHYQCKHGSLATMASTDNIPSSTPVRFSLVTTSILPSNSTFTPLASINRSFGRKGSKMGHHIQNLDEMAHTENREEAKHKREEKKAKSKKARVASHAEYSSHDNANSSGDNDDSGSAGGGSSDGDFGPKEDANGNPLLPESSAVRSNMLMVVTYLEKALASIRGGEATPELFDSVRVSAYGEMVSLSSVGQVVIEDAQRATISCYDPSVTADVRDAVRDMPGMNLSPYIEEGGSGVVIIPIPRVSEETRKEIVKELGNKAENGRQRVRKIRRAAMDIVKKGKDGKLDGISKDDAFRLGKDVETVTEDVLAGLNELVEKKQRSVMDD